jgi:hypothetical protein
MRASSLASIGSFLPTIPDPAISLARQPWVRQERMLRAAPGNKFNEAHRRAEDGGNRSPLGVDVAAK